ncbi:MAG: Flp family type IVb pilin [Sphingomonadales bacterium]
MRRQFFVKIARLCTGATVVEYALIIALIAGAAMLAMEGWTASVIRILDVIQDNLELDRN